MRSQQMLIAFYRDLIIDAQELEFYERLTSLGDPDAIDVQFGMQS
jgi:hypothetical protein